MTEVRCLFSRMLSEPRVNRLSRCATSPKIAQTHWACGCFATKCIERMASLVLDEQVTKAPKSPNRICSRATRGSGPQNLMPDPNADIVKGYRFSATLQLRTPLRVLQHHGEVQQW